MAEYGNNVKEAADGAKVQIVDNRGMLDKIVERQKLSEQGIYPPLIIYPEGGTHNGKYLVNWKQGAFVGLNSI